MHFKAPIERAINRELFNCYFLGKLLKEYSKQFDLLSIFSKKYAYKSSLRDKQSQSRNRPDHLVLICGPKLEPLDLLLSPFAFSRYLQNLFDKIGEKLSQKYLRQLIETAALLVRHQNLKGHYTMIPNL